MTLNSTLTAAIADIEQNGFDSDIRLQEWLNKIQKEIERGQVPDSILYAKLKKSFEPKLKNILRKNSNIPGWRKERLNRSLYAELDRRIIAAASLIKLNKQQAVNDTLRRFVGWSTSIPAGGGIVDSKIETKQDIKKSMADMSFIERRCAIDQAAKLVSNINNIVAVDNGAIAVEWNSHWRQKNYNFRKDHKELDGKIFLIRGSWADKDGLVKGEYYDDIEPFGQAVYCRCYGRYIYKLKSLPDENLTKNKNNDILPKIDK